MSHGPYLDVAYRWCSADDPTIYSLVLDDEPQIRDKTSIADGDRTFAYSDVGGTDILWMIYVLPSAPPYMRLIPWRVNDG